MQDQKNLSIMQFRNQSTGTVSIKDPTKHDTNFQLNLQIRMLEFITLTLNIHHQIRTSQHSLKQPLLKYPNKLIIREQRKNY